MNAKVDSTTTKRAERHARALAIKNDLFGQFQRAFLSTIDDDPSGATGMGKAKKLRDELCGKMPQIRHMIASAYDRFHEVAKTQVDLTK